MNTPTQQIPANLAIQFAKLVHYLKIIVNLAKPTIFSIQHKIYVTKFALYITTLIKIRHLVNPAIFHVILAMDPLQSIVQFVTFDIYY